MGSLFSPPQYQQPAPDPALAQLQAQSEAQNQQAIQTQVQSDTSRIMAMYGAHAAMGTTASAPGVMPMATPNLTSIIAAGAKA